jgi:hypothetical protein
MFLIWQKIIFLILILLPILSTLLFHPSTYIKKISKITIIATLICISFVSPIIILIHLRYLSLLILFLPILFRGIELTITKLNFTNRNQNINKDFIERLLSCSIGALAFILLTIDYNMWGGFWVAFAIIIFSIMPKIDNLNILYGIFFGGLSFVMPLIFKDERGISTYLVSWTIYTLLFYYVPLAKRILKSQTNTVILILITTAILMKHGGISVSWNNSYATILLIVIIHIFIVSLYYFIEKLKKNNVQYWIKQYYLHVVLIAIVLTLIYFKNE